MRDELNRMIAEGELHLQPLNTDGVSVNVTPAGAAFVLADDRQRVIRIYANAAPLTDFIKTRPQLLLELLTLTGPASPWPLLRLGIDPRARFLWMSTAIAYDVASASRLREAYEHFSESASQLAAAVTARINQAAQSTPPSAGMEAFSPGAAPNAASAAELQSLMNNPNVLWG